jgi:diadenosine tetraphosphate (Ap4A) HIT family hydrolase
MTEFTLDPRLAGDCIVLGELPLSRLLLMDNALLTWFILVPRRQAVELFQLEEDDQLLLLDEINHLSRFVKKQFSPDKLNVAAIGNIVKQLHIHLVGRTVNDICWPNVVWGLKEREPYGPEQLAALRNALRAALPVHLFQPL